MYCSTIILDQDAFAAAAVKLTVKNLLPGAEIQAPLGHRNHNFPAYYRAFQVAFALFKHKCDEGDLPQDFENWLENIA